ncbi:hypothetical protein HK096_001073, partial [Nowakowskiella sp. JEL0078]
MEALKERSRKKKGRPLHAASKPAEPAEPAEPEAQHSQQESEALGNIEIRLSSTLAQTLSLPVQLDMHHLAYPVLLQPADKPASPALWEDVMLLNEPDLRHALLAPDSPNLHLSEPGDGNSTGTLYASLATLPPAEQLWDFDKELRDLDLPSAPPQDLELYFSGNCVSLAHPASPLDLAAIFDHELFSEFENPLLDQHSLLVADFLNHNVSPNTDDEFYRHLSSYETAFLNTLRNKISISRLQASINSVSERLWTIKKSSKVADSTCRDGVNLRLEFTQEEALFDDEKSKELDGLLKEFRILVYDKQMKDLFESKIEKLWVMNYIDE